MVGRRLVKNNPDNRFTQKLISTLGILGALAALAVARPCAAQLGEPSVPIPQIAPTKNAGPSLEDTLAWIKEKVEMSSRGHWDNANTFSEIEFIARGCDVTMISWGWDHIEDSVQPTDEGYAELLRTVPSSVSKVLRFNLADAMELRPADYADRGTDFFSISALGNANNFLEMNTSEYFRQKLYGKYRHIEDVRSLHLFDIAEFRKEILEDDGQSGKFMIEKTHFLVLDPALHGDRNADLRVRVANALNHAIRLCRRRPRQPDKTPKKELF